MRERAAAWMRALHAGPLEEKDPNEHFAERKRLYELYLDTAGALIVHDSAEIIDKDMARTKVLGCAPDTPGDYLDLPDFSGSIKRESVRRVLRVYSTTNKTVGYVQGMNVLCALLYCVIDLEISSTFSESVTYFCFFNLMVDLGDLFSEKMDDSSVGARGQARKILCILKKQDKGLYAAVSKLNLFETTSFHLKWMFLMFSSEFSVPETLVLWDRFFLEAPKYQMLPYFSAATLMLLRRSIIGQPSHQVFSTLQALSVSPAAALKKAEVLFQKDLHG
ncbi:hypothetical protein NEDG_01517 [Nematocida displodere]|uniref:Rab-GAP TBC domain-containing protein n=1 Tax=Nematocida displodere TaxID=1805483 RepID=A0A177EEY7_9MICR|nr:hypothetical protein NEDG_01517 [Nematocida displodere]